MLPNYTLSARFKRGVIGQKMKSTDDFIETQKGGAGVGSKKDNRAQEDFGS